MLQHLPLSHDDATPVRRISIRIRFLPCRSSTQSSVETADPEASLRRYPPSEGATLLEVPDKR